LERFLFTTKLRQSSVQTMPSKKRNSGTSDEFDFKFKKDEKVLILPVHTGDDIYEAKVLECKMKAKKPQYKIHYKGWNKRWDEWVDHGRLLKINASNLQIMQEKKSQNREQQLKQQQLQQQQSQDANAQSAASDSSGKKRKSRGSATNKHGSSSSNSSKRRRLNEDDHKQRDSAKASGDALSIPLEIKLPTPLKRKLIADWERITKKNMVMTLPRTSGTRVCDILSDFEEFATEKGQDPNIVAEIARGIKDYFNQALQVTLLYKLERSQLHSLSRSAQFSDLSMDQIYGVEHLCRLFVKLPQLLSPNDLDAGTRAILKMQIEFIVEFVLQKEEYWQTDYVSPSTH